MNNVAFGKPGITPTWSSSDKDFVTTALGASRLWVAVGHGIVNEVYLGGYHLVWPRDATLSAFALLGANQRSDVRHMLGHLIAMQRRDGRWPQNYFPSGESFWTGTQLDETGFPVLLAAKLRELGVDDLLGTAEMVRAAEGFIARTRPSSEQDRWEENPGVSPFTVAVVISALIAAEPWLTPEERVYAASLADDWNDRLEGWCYAEDTALSRRVDVAGHYVRLAPPDKTGYLSFRVQLRNRDGETILGSGIARFAHRGSRALHVAFRV